MIRKGWIRFNSARYWNDRYAHGGDSGDGSKGQLAVFKATFLNRFVEENQLVDIVELGCGDGLQLQWANYPRYTGFDISRVAIQRCIKKFEGDSSKKFEVWTGDTDPGKYGATWDLALSLDVLYHIIDDTGFEQYLHTLFRLARYFVIIYAPDQEQTQQGPVHIRFRKFSDYIRKNFPQWELSDRISPPLLSGKYGTGSYSSSEFFIYRPIQFLPG